jgi:hypothetical protein
VNFAAITLYIASERVFVDVSIHFFMTQSGNFWIHPLKCRCSSSSVEFLCFASRVRSVLPQNSSDLFTSIHYYVKNSCLYQNPYCSPSNLNFTLLHIFNYLENFFLLISFPPNTVIFAFELEISILYKLINVIHKLRVQF